MEHTKSMKACYILLLICIGTMMYQQRSFVEEMFVQLRHGFDQFGDGNFLICAKEVAKALFKGHPLENLEGQFCSATELAWVSKTLKAIACDKVSSSSERIQSAIGSGHFCRTLKYLVCKPCHMPHGKDKEPKEGILKDFKTMNEFIENCKDIDVRLVSFRRQPTQKTTDSNQTLVVPNIVHYVWFTGGVKNFTFLSYVSFLGTDRILKPEAIYLHGDKEPESEWWKETCKHVPNVYFVYKKRQNHIFGTEISHIEHSADIARLEILYDYGGIYLDTDAIPVKSFLPLLKYDTTMGRGGGTNLECGLIVARRCAPFLKIWMESYRTFNPHRWVGHSTIMPGKLQQLLPRMIHVQPRFHGPQWEELKALFRKGFKWSTLYAVHVYKNWGKVPRNPEETKTLDTALGEVMRYAYFGSKELIN